MNADTSRRRESYSQAEEARFSGEDNHLPRVWHTSGMTVATQGDNRSCTRAQITHNENKTEALLGLCNLFRRFFSSCSRFAAPLNEKLRRDQLTTFPCVTNATKERSREPKGTPGVPASSSARKQNRPLYGEH